MSADGRHYQKKVKTSEEAQQARKEKEKRKIDEYRALSDKLSEKRRNREFDDEALGLTTSIVSLNPEFYTAWNFRREILLETFKSLDEDERQKRCLSELKLVEDALRLNPKSYWVWNHRRWTLQTMPRPDWNKEFKLLSMMLDLDARNFHGWDYRRYVIAQTSNRTPKEEFEYTSAKINQNFSNYSAWHHRSKVLAEAFPDDQERDRVIQNDFEIVRNAVYTEPADQSAWLYQRWLLGKKKEPLEVRKAYIMKLENTRYLLVVCFNQSVKAFGSDAIAIKIGNRIIKEMRPVIDTSLAFCPVQRLEILEEIELHDGGSSEVAVAILKDGVVGLNGIRLGKDWQGTVSLGTGMLPGTCLEVSFQLTAEVDSPTTSSGGSLSYQPDSVWRRELQSIQELVEIEPDSKWALLTLVHIMNELGGHDAKAIGILEKLENLDSYRANYYRDLKSEVLVQRALSVIGTQDSDSIALSSISLTTLPMVALSSLSTAKTVDLSNNALRRMHHVGVFVFVETLVLDGNSIETVEGLAGLFALRKLSLKHNSIRSRAGLTGLGALPNLTEISLAGNPIVGDNGPSDDLLVYLKELVPGLSVVDGRQL